MSVKPKFSKRDFLKMAGFGIASASILACGAAGEAASSHSSLPLPKDLSLYPSSELGIATGGYTPSTFDGYQTAYMDQLLNPGSSNYFGRQASNPDIFPQRVISQNFQGVTQSIMDTLVIPDGTVLNGGGSYTNDLAHLDRWLLITNTSQEGTVTHTRLLQAIGQQGLKSDTVKFQGYFKDVSQTFQSNILRQVMVVEFEGRSYILKIAPAEDAYAEMSALSILNGSEGAPKVPKSTTFKLMKSPTSKISFTISDAELNGSVLAPNILNKTSFTPAQRGQLEGLYKSYIANLFNADIPVKYQSDIVAPYNIVENTLGDLVVVDGMARPRQTTSAFSVSKNQTVTTDAVLRRQLQLTNDIFMKDYGFTADELVTIQVKTSNALLGNGGNIGRVLAQGDTIEIPVTNVPPDIAPINQIITNDTPNEVIVPKNIDYGFAKGLNIGMTAINGVFLGKWIAENQLSTDDFYDDVVIPPSDSHSRRGLEDPAAIYTLTMESKYEAYRLGHTTFSFSVPHLAGKIELHEKVRSLRSGFGLVGDEQIGREGLILQLGDLPYSGKPLLSVHTSDGPDSDVVFSSKAPLIVQLPDGSLEYQLVPLSGTLSGVADETQNESMRTYIDQMSTVLSNEYLDLASRGEKWKILESLRRRQEQGEIDLFTVTDTGYVMIGYQVGSTVELQYLTYIDPNTPMDVSEKLLNRAVTMQEIVS